MAIVREFGNQDNFPVEWEDIISKGVKEWRGNSLKSAVICRYTTCGG